MTWHTSRGDRYLVAHESRVFRLALRSAIEVLELNMLDCSRTMLEGQTRKARLYLFAYVGKHLLLPTDDLAPLNAWTEAAVAIVFRQLTAEVEIEIDAQEENDEEYRYFWRKAILAAADDDAIYCASAEPMDHCSTNLVDWRFLIEHLQHKILWDIDWMIEFDSYSNVTKQIMGIDQEYFDWNRSLFQSTRAAVDLLGDLCGFRRGESEGLITF